MRKKNAIGTFEAKTNFTCLIQRAHKDEEILITKRGQPMARIVPLERHQNTLTAQMAVDRVKSLAQEMQLGKFDWEEWKNYRDRGKNRCALSTSQYSKHPFLNSFLMK